MEGPKKIKNIPKFLDANTLSEYTAALKDDKLYLPMAISAMLVYEEVRHSSLSGSILIIKMGLYLLSKLGYIVTRRKEES